MMTGVGVLFAVVALSEGLPAGWGFYAIELTAVVCAVGVACVYRARCNFFRLPRTTQVVLVCLAWLMQLLIFTVSVVFGV